MKRTSEWLILITVILILALLLPSLLTFLPRTSLSPDLTENGLFTVSETTKNFLSALERDVTLYVLKPTYAKDFDLILSGLADLSSHIRVEYVKEADTDDFMSKFGATAENVTTDSIVAETDLRYAYVDHYSFYYYSSDSFELSYSEYAQYYEYYYQYYLQNQDSTYLEQLAAMELTFKAEKELISVIEYVTAEVLPHPYLMSTGEANVYADNFKKLIVAMGNDVGAADLSKSDIPDDCGELMILYPETDLTDVEYGRIRGYLARGGRITLIGDAVASEMPNFAKLLDEYGLSQSAGTVSVPMPTEEESSETEGSEPSEEPEVPEEPTPVYSSTFIPDLNEQDMALAYLVSSGYTSAITLDSVRPILVDESRLSASQIVTSLMLTPENSLLGSDKGVFNCAVKSEQIENGKSSVIVWFVSPENYQIVSGSETISSYAPLVPLYESMTVSRSFESQIGEIPSKIMTEPSFSVAKSTKGLVVFIMVFLLPLIFVFLAWYIPFKRKKIA